MSNFYSPPLSTEVDAESPINETLMSTRIRGSIVGMGVPNSVFDSFCGDGSGGAQTDSITATISVTTAGLQYTSWTLEAGVVITLQDGSPDPNGVYKIGVQGTLTLTATSEITAVGTGLAGGARGVTGTSLERAGLFQACGGGGGGGGGSNMGSTATAGARGGGVLSDTADSNGGAGGGAGAIGSVGGAGSAGTAAVSSSGRYYGFPGMFGPAPGGGGSGNGHNHGGTYLGVGGGSGGAIIILECDTLVFPAGAVIDASGEDGTDGPNATSDSGGPGGGGGGAGGVVLVFCRTATTNAGTVQANGGSGGSYGTGDGNGERGGNGGNGGAGFAAVVELT